MLLHCLHVSGKDMKVLVCRRVNKLGNREVLNIFSSIRVRADKYIKTMAILFLFFTLYQGVSYGC